MRRRCNHELGPPIIDRYREDDHSSEEEDAQIVFERPFSYNTPSPRNPTSSSHSFSRSRIDESFQIRSERLSSPSRVDHWPGNASSSKSENVSNSRIDDSFKIRSARARSPCGLDYHHVHVSPLTSVHKRTLTSYLTPCRYDIFLGIKDLVKSQLIETSNFVGVIFLASEGSVKSSTDAFTQHSLMHLHDRGIGRTTEKTSRPVTPLNSRSPAQRTFFISATTEEERNAWLLEITHQAPTSRLGKVSSCLHNQPCC
jgi:hypothetical protein